MIDTELPKPVIKTKKFNPQLEARGLDAGLHPVLARVIASRPVPLDIPIEQVLSPKLKQLWAPTEMADMDKAANRLAKAIIEGECIGLETDHDCDGQTSHAVLYHNLVTHFKQPKEKIRSYIGHRLTEGYGLSESVATRILDDTPRVTLLITADNGSSDEPRIERLKKAGIDVIVTDHHEIPKDGIPKSAYACLNPTREDCKYSDTSIAGCMVAWLLMTMTRQKLIDLGYLSKNAPTLSDSLDFVAVGTIADCVSMAKSINNRAVVLYGLKRIEQGLRPCWRAMKTVIKEAVSSEDLGFKIGPLLNSDGRLATAFGSVSFLLSETDEEAMAFLYSLEEYNQERKAIQKAIVEQGLKIAKQQMKAGRHSLCLYLEEGHSGVHGIAASRLKDLFGRPTVFLAPKQAMEGVITGSVRGIEGFHVRKALQTVADEHPLLLMSFGGHQGAGGVTLTHSGLSLFSEAFEKAVLEQLGNRVLGPVIWTEGALTLKAVTLDLIDSLNQLEPFGREFEKPIFETEAFLKELKFVGDGTHARVVLENDKTILKGIWFKAREKNTDTLDISIGDLVKAAFLAKANDFKGQRTPEMQILQITK